MGDKNTKFLKLLTGKAVKLAKMANFSVESGSESGSSFIRPLKESVC